MVNIGQPVPVDPRAGSFRRHGSGAAHRRSSVAQHQVAANRAPGFLGDHVAELSEGEQVCARGHLAIGVRVVEGDAPAPHAGPARKGEAAGQVDPDVAVRWRLVTTSEVGTAGAPRSSTGDVAAETRRMHVRSVGDVPDRIVGSQAQAQPITDPSSSATSASRRSTDCASS